MYNHYHTWGLNLSERYLNAVCYFGLFCGSTYLFYSSVNEINKISLSNNNKDTLHKYLILFNGSIALFSGLTVAYTTTKLIK